MKSSKAAFITGGAKRIGRAIALNLAQLGYDIAITYNTSEDEAKELQNEIIATFDRKCKIYKCNFINESESANIFNKVSQDLSNIKLVINNASIFEKSDLLGPDEQYENNFNIHLKAPINISKQFAQYIENNSINQANIINILDKNIVRHSSNFFYYLLSKKSLCELTKMLATQLAPDIRVNAIAPGYILDDHFIDNSQHLSKKIIEKIPLLKKGNIEHILKTTRFIIDNDYITGQILFIDGGSSLNLTNN
jgi:pteridine reductase